MTIEIKDGRYFSTFYFCEFESARQDWHGALYRDRDASGKWTPWVFFYRFRYYVDNKAHDSDDVKNWYSVTIDRSEAEALKVIQQMASMISKHYDGAPVHKVIVKSSKAEEVAKALQRESWTHIKQVKEVEEKP